MKERPILFSAPMVRAILDGRKTQTRRVIKPQPHGIMCRDPISPSGIAFDSPAHGEQLLSCPYGKVGDRLWVRETFSYDALDIDRDGILPLWYWADGNPQHGDWSKPKPSIHMPRWASRIDLEITGVRVERLNDISEYDAEAEGAERHTFETPEQISMTRFSDGFDNGYFPDYNHVDGFHKLWESINGAGSWQQNPWVWVIEFKKV